MAYKEKSILCVPLVISLW